MPISIKTVWSIILSVTLSGACAAQKPMAFNPDEKSLTDIQTALNNGQLTSESLVQAYLKRIAAIDQSGPTLNSIIAINPDAIRIAHQLDKERAQGKLRGPLHGIPILLKDNIESLDPIPTTAGSLALKDNISDRDAPIVARLRSAGAIILGKTNLSEWANIRSSHSISGWSAVGGLTRNPYALSRNTCGSSSGSGVAIAASLAVMAVGTETDGSITCPSAINGLVGFKPTVGLLSQKYIIPISHSQDTAGPMARSVYDAAVLLNAMSTLPASPDYVRHLNNTSLKGLRLGVMRPLSGYHPGADAVFEQTLAALEKAGAVLVEVKIIDSISDISKNEFTVLLSELKHNLNAYLADTPKTVKTRSLAELIAFNREHATAEMPYFGQDLFEAAQQSSDLQSADYQRALANSGKVARTQLDSLLAQYEVAALVAPSGSPAWTTDLLNGDHYLGSASTLPAVAGYPHLTVPMGTVQGMPVGISIITGQWQDSKALQIGHAIEQETLARQPPRYLLNIP